MCIKGSGTFDIVRLCRVENSIFGLGTLRPRRGGHVSVTCSWAHSPEPEIIRDEGTILGIVRYPFSDACDLLGGINLISLTPGVICARTIVEF